MIVSLHINSTTTIRFETYKVMERDLFEPIFDGKKYNFKIYSFYSLYKINEPTENLDPPDLKEFPRLYHKSLLLEPHTGEKYLLIRSVSDDIIQVEDAIRTINSTMNDESITVIIENINLTILKELDEYNLGRFLDTQVDRAMLPVS